MPFNQLSDAEAERPAILSEELGEAQQAVGKILRHGYESRHPDGGPTNRESLERELGDVRFAVAFMGCNGDIRADAVMAAQARKDKTIAEYLHHQKHDGAHEPENDPTDNRVHW